MKIGVTALVATGALAAATTGQAQTPAAASQTAMPPPVAAPSPAATAPAAAPPARAEGYLDPSEVPDTFHVLPPAPKDGSPARAEDIAAFRETRKLKGTPRWDLATADASITGLVADFNCALGASLSPQAAPKTYRLFSRVSRDTSRITNTPKDQFKQVRPFAALGDVDPICTEQDRAGLAKSYSYPSGHTTLGWTWGLVMAQAAPDKATAVTARARAYGESRVVCGVHWASDVDAGRTNASVLVAVLNTKPEFTADLAAAKAEIAAARAAQGSTAPGAPGRCEMEAAAAATTPWTR